MIVKTTRFGALEVKEQSIVQMPEGLFGLEQCKRFVLLEEQPEAAFKWMQSIDDPAVAFIVVNPMDFFPEYSIERPDDQAELLGLQDPADAAMLTTVTIRGDGSVTTNLAGPVVLNSKSLCAYQVVLQDERYCTAHVIADKASAQSSPELAKAA